MRLDPDALVKFNEAANALPESKRDFFGKSLLAVRLSRNDSAKAAALVFRMEALARLVRRGVVKDWTLRERADDGAVFTKQEVLRAAALEPLIARRGQFVFERSSFLERVLLLAEVNRPE